MTTRASLHHLRAFATRQRMRELAAILVFGSCFAALVLNIIDAISQMLGRG